MGSKTNKSYTLSYFIIFIGFLLSCLIFYKVNILEDKFAQYKFKEERENYLSVLNTEINKNIDVLNKLKHFFLSSKNVDREEFKKITKEFLENNKKIKSLSWIPLVKNNERIKYEKSAQKEGYKEFQFNEIGLLGQMEERGDSLQYYPIYYIEPLRENKAILGLDLFSDKDKAEAILSSLKTGKITEISKIRLFSEKNKKGEFLLLNPVYKENLNPKKKILGFILGVFKIDDIINSSFDLLTKNNLDFQIYDPIKNINIPIYTTKDYFERENSYQFSNLYSENFIESSNQNWKIKFIPGKLFFLNEFIKLDWTIFIFFNLITLMFSRSIYNKTKYTHKIKKLTENSAEDHKKLRLFAHIIENIPEGIMITDKYNKIISINDSFLKTTGYRKKDLIGSNPKILTSNHHTPFFYKEMWNSIKYKGSWRGEIWDRRKNGKVHPGWLNIITIQDIKKTNNIDYYVGMFSDLSNQEHIRKQIQHLAYYDSLTDLPNRGLFHSKAKNLIIDADIEKTKIAFVFLDLDRFKNINDALGHSAGDELLKEVAKSLKEIKLEDEIVSRFGGDEFVILIPNFDLIDDLNKRIISILNVFQSPFNIDGKELFVTSSIGVSLYPLNGDSLDELIKNADTAMYFAKKSGKNNFKFYTKNMNSKSIKNLGLENKMRQALQDEEFHLEYQPQISTITHKITSCEALIRWNSPEFGTISPDEFISIAEDSGFIVPITRWILEKVFYDLKKIIQIDPNIYISINISGYQIKHSDLPKMIEEVLEQEKIDLKHIELELTESVLMDDVFKNEKIMSKLKDLNIKLAIDDFGTGYSSLSYLKKFPIDRLKIDRSFIDGITNNEEDKIIVKTIISMAHTLGFKTIGEGVETKQQFDFLKAYKCDEVQGYYFSKPVSIEKIKEYLEENILSN